MTAAEDAETIKNSEELFEEVFDHVKDRTSRLAKEGGDEDTVMKIRMGDVVTLLTTVAVYRAKNELNERRRDETLTTVKGHTQMCIAKDPRLKGVHECNCAFGTVRKTWGQDR